MKGLKMADGTSRVEVLNGQYTHAAKTIQTTDS